MVRCAVLGSPIRHSLSPALHREAYARLGLTDWRYDAFEIDEPRLRGFLDELGSEWRGLSLTMPLKRAVIPLCDRVSRLAETVGAVNTVVLGPGDRDRGERFGTNTDVPGAVNALAERGVSAVGDAVLLGVGATAASTVAALAELGVRRVVALARDVERAGSLQALAERLEVRLDVRPFEPASLDALPPVPAAEPPSGSGRDRLPALAISTVPAAVAGALADNLVRRVNVVFDVVYDPWPTPLTSAARALGRTVVNGLDLLVHQAALQVELMTGRSPAPVAAMRAAGEAGLADRT